MTENESPQPKAEEVNTQVTNPDQNQPPKENHEQNQDNNPVINAPPKLKESQVAPEEEKKEEEKKEEEKKEEEKKEEEKKEEEKKEEEKKEKEKKEEENQPPNPKEKEGESQIPKPNENNIHEENQPVKEPPKQELQNPQNDEIQEIEEVKPEPKVIDNKIKFTHPMNYYCSPENIKEIETCPPDKLFPVISKRLVGIETKLADILKNHERYTLICLYYKIYANFTQNTRLGRNPKVMFQQKDPTSRLKITDYDFQEILVNTLNCQLTTDEIFLILRSLKQKTETLYSYDEFLKNVENVHQNENEFKQIYKECSFYFDDYIYSFRHFIQDNQIDYRSAFSRACTGITNLKYEDSFKRFLAEIGFKLGNEREISHLFCALSEANYTPSWNNMTFQVSITLNLNTNVLIPSKTLFGVADLSDISEEEFCKKGQVINKSTKSNEWKKNIMNFTQETKKLHRKQFESFRNVFQNIHKKCLEYEVNDLTKFFEDSDFDISPDGDIEIKDFRDALVNIRVSYNVQLDTLVNRFKNMKKRPKEMLKLVEFLSIYNLFTMEGNENEENEEKIEKEKESVIEKEEDKKVYVYRTAHRKFTQEDIDYIYEICEGIAEIISDELHDSITNFFNKKDKNNQGYITFNDFKDILTQDLKVDYKSDIENFQIFFDFVLSDKMIQGEDIIETKKLIKILKTYGQRDQPEKSQKEEEEEDIADIRKTKKKAILFEEEEEMIGTKGANTNNNIINSNIEKDEDENDKINKSLELINTQINTSVISFDKIMSEFAHYLFTNRIRFSSIFPSINLEKLINNQTISAETLKLGFQNASYPISEKEFSVIMTHFDPVNKEKVLVEDLKHEISRYEPYYFKQNYQKIDPEEIENRLKQKNRELEKSATSTFGKNVFNSNLLNGMNKIQTFLDRNNLTVENFFFGRFCKKSTKNENLKVNEEMWKNEFIPKDKTKSDYISNLQANEVDAIYKAIDTKSSDRITLGEIISFFNKYLKKSENILNFNDQSSLNEYIKNELKILFDMFDKNKNDMILFEDFYRCLKSLDHKATKIDAQDIIAKYPNQNPSNINRETFNQIMFKFIQKELVIQKEEKNYIKKLFLEADLDKNGYLTRKQIKHLIKDKIGCNLTDAEFEEIFDKVDIKQEDEIDIRDFIYLLDNINSLQRNIKVENTISTKLNQDEELIPIMNLNLNLNMHRKMRPKDFISLYSDLPLSFIPSFIRDEQQKGNLLPSKCLKPLTKDDINYEDIKPIQELVYGDKKGASKDQNKNIELIHPIKRLDYFVPRISCKIYFDDYATGVSSPDETFFETPNSHFKVVGRLLKISLFNNMYKTFIGNAISIDCIYKKEYQDRWYFESDDSKYNNNIIIRYNERDYDNVDVVFEFVLVIQKEVEHTNYTIETSCGWCAIPMKNLQLSRKEKLPIKGGSPLGVSDISELDIRKKRIGFIPKLATLFEGQIQSECPIRVKIFKDLNNEEKKYINYLPGLIVCHSAAMNMISIYRQILGEYILNHKDYLIKCIQEENDLANMFCRIADVPDAFRVMNEVWKEIILDGSPSNLKNDENFLRKSFDIFVKKINNILYAEKFKYNPLDPTELPRGDIRLMQDRDILLNSTLRENQDKKFNKLEYRMEDNSYKPFTMDEINGQKGNGILEKIEEIITSINVS